MELADELTLNIHEIYRTIQGETSRVGLPCVIIRTAGCDLRCTWCDTLDATLTATGKTMTIREICNLVEPLGTHLICITGGEPLLQKHTPALAAMLAAGNYTVQVETNGAQAIAPLRAPIVRIMDIKCPSSGMARHFNWYNLQELRSTDEVKFVIADRDDYEYAREIIEKHSLSERCHILLSPLMATATEKNPATAAKITPALLAEWMLWDDVNARLQLQLHKIIWATGEPKS